MVDFNSEINSEVLGELPSLGFRFDNCSFCVRMTEKIENWHENAHELASPLFMSKCMPYLKSYLVSLRFYLSELHLWAPHWRRYTKKSYSNRSLT